MTRFPFEEDRRHRFGEFHRLLARYIFIGRTPQTGTPPQPVKKLPAELSIERIAAATPARPETADALSGGAPCMPSSRN